MMKKRIIIITLFMIVLRIVLSLGYEPYIAGNYKYDDFLFLNIASSMIDGNYLGDYNQLTLTKGIGFPLVVTLIHYSHIPYTIFFTLLYIIASLCLTKALYNFFKKEIVIYISLFLIMFNPISFSSDIFLHFYRNGINLIFIMFYFAYMLSLFNNKKKSYLLLGLLLFLISIMREDYIWVLPCLLILFIPDITSFIKDKKVVILKPMLIFIGTFIGLNCLLASINLSVYKEYTTNELKNSSFKDAYVALLSVAPTESIKRVSITPDTLEKVSEISPNFKLVYNEIKTFNLNDEIIDGTMIWIMRTAAYNIGKYDNSKVSNLFWKEIENDINKAFKEGKLNKRIIIPSIYFSPYQKGYISDFITDFSKTSNIVMDYNKIEIGYKYSCTSSDNIKKLNEITNSHSKSILNSSNDNNLRTTILNIYKSIYNVINAILVLISFIGLILIIKAKQHINIKVIGGLLCSYILLLCGVAYTNVSAFDSIEYKYLAPGYIISLLITLFIIFSWRNKHES